MMKKHLYLFVKINAVIMILILAYIFFIPAVILFCDLRDPGLYSNEMPRCVFRWHKALSPKYEKWARKRVTGGAATKLSTENISGTEWPVFGSVFYLWATEALQEAFEENPKQASSAPKDYARGAIEAAAALVADPNHANWVKQHWGDDYLEKENLFYRMLLISGLTSYQKLTGDGKYEVLLRSQVESLAKELDESPRGLLDDYPGQCYPVDIVPAIAAIRRADAVLGTDHSKFAARAIRGFQGNSLDPDTGLPAYVVNSKTGRAMDSARGVGLSFMLIWAPELWQETAQDWYGKYEEHFWQQEKWLAGFREFPRGTDPGNFIFIEVDAGPVVAGYGAAACAFGIGAARAMGRFDHAYCLSTQAIVGSWPLPDGTLLGPRILSNISDAPYLGEAAILFALSRKPVGPVLVSERTKLPMSVYAGIAFIICVGTYEVVATIRKLRRWKKHHEKFYVPAPEVQIWIWMGLMVSSLFIWAMISAPVGLIVLLAAQLVPFKLRKRHYAEGEVGKEGE
ncbi:MAG: hypothetical protein JW715_11075 [Sedimentisphaerales bacterium]|nr:hypothetical protein [Sedimentisphaerales bacterium]